MLVSKKKRHLEEMPPGTRRGWAFRCNFTLPLELLAPGEGRQWAWLLSPYSLSPTQKKKNKNKTNHFNVEHLRNIPPQRLQELTSTFNGLLWMEVAFPGGCCHEHQSRKLVTSLTLNLNCQQSEDWKHFIFKFLWVSISILSSSRRKGSLKTDQGSWFLFSLSMLYRWPRIHVRKHLLFLLSALS